MRVFISEDKECEMKKYCRYSTKERTHGTLSHFIDIEFFQNWKWSSNVTSTVVTLSCTCSLIKNLKQKFKEKQ